MAENKRIFKIAGFVLVVALGLIVFNQFSGYSVYQGFTGFAAGNPTFNIFYGSVNYANGTAVKDGIKVRAEIEEKEIIAITSVLDGMYGSDFLFMVEGGDDGDVVLFYVEDEYVGDLVFNEYGITEFNLEVHVCGDGLCTGDEDCSSCETDCGACSPGDNGGSSCFPAGTKILMGDGEEKAIEDVVVGDFVMSYDEVLGVQVVEEVLELESPVREHMCEIEFVGGAELKLTNEHPVYTSEGWKSIEPAETLRENSELVVDRLNIGDKVLFEKGDYEEVVSINCWKEVVQTYNLKDVEGFNNYYAEEVLVHNKGGSGPPPTCTEDWICEDWSSCVNNRQTRVCTDLNDCDTTENKPEESRRCLSGPADQYLAPPRPGDEDERGPLWPYILALVAILIVVFFIILLLIRKRKKRKNKVDSIKAEKVLRKYARRNRLH